MVKQSKNKVKLNKDYQKIGIVPKKALNKISEYFNIPNNATTIRSNPSNVLKHNKSHLNAIKKALDELGITKEGYAEYVAKTITKLGLAICLNQLFWLLKPKRQAILPLLICFLTRTKTFGLSSRFTLLA